MYVALDIRSSILCVDSVPFIETLLISQYSIALYVKHIYNYCTKNCIMQHVVMHDEICMYVNNLSFDNFYMCMDCNAALFTYMCKVYILYYELDALHCNKHLV